VLDVDECQTVAKDCELTGGTCVGHHETEAFICVCESSGLKLDPTDPNKAKCIQGLCVSPVFLQVALRFSAELSCVEF